MLVSRRGSASALLVISALLVSGCSAGPGARIDSPPIAGADPKKLERADPAVPSDELTADVSFEAGAALPPDWSVQWGDPFLVDEHYSIESADDGNGAWSYRDEQTQCVLRFWQGTLEDMDRESGDRAASDAFLASILDASPEEIETYAYDDSLSEVLSGASVDVRTVTGEADDGMTWVDSVRAFTATGAGMYAGLECPAGQEAVDVRDELAAGDLHFIAAGGF